MLSMEYFEQTGLDAIKLDITEKLAEFNAKFASKVTAENGFFGMVEDLSRIIKEQTGWSDEIIDAISSPEEYKVLKDAGLKEYDIGGKKYLFKTDIDWSQLDEFGRSNADRVGNGLNPIAKNGETIEYHHIGQGKNAPLAELTRSEHDKIPVDTKTPSEVRPHGDNTEWNKQKRQLLKLRKDAVLLQKSTFTMAVEAGHETGLKSGLTAAGITAAISTVENVRGYMSGELTAQEAFVDVAKDTGTAAAIGYGTGFVSGAIANATRASSHALIKTLGKANVTGAAIAFGIASYDSVIDYAQGKINGEQLAYDLGKNASGVGGATVGATGGAMVGSVVPVVGTVVGGLVGGMVGYAVATEAYATAMELAAKSAQVVADVAGNVYGEVSTAVVDGAEALKDKAVAMGQSVIDTVTATAPEALDTVKSSMNDFAASLGTLIRF